MKVSVVVCSYSLDTFDACREAIESVLAQTYEDVELVVVVDGNEELYDRIVEQYDSITVHLNEENLGLSKSRNRGFSLATGDVIAFLDDDAVADERWVEELVSVYEAEDTIAVGGKMVSEWVAGKPSFLPEEFYWLVGVTHRGFAEPGEEVRNTFGSNISFRREVFEEIGTFDPELGRRGSLNVQAEETVFCVRMSEAFGRGVVYNPDAVVAHKVFDYRTEPTWLIERAFWQGYSKHVLGTLVPEASGENESAYLRDLLLKFVPERIRGLVGSPSKDEALQLGAVFVFTATVGFGYVYSVVRSLIADVRRN